MITEYQWIFFFLLPSVLIFELGCAVFLSILYFISAMLSFFFLFNSSGDIVFDSFVVSFDVSIFADVNSKVFEWISAFIFYLFFLSFYPKMMLFYVFYYIFVFYFLIKQFNPQFKFDYLIYV